MNVYNTQDEIAKQAEQKGWGIQERIRASLTDADHDELYMVAELVLGKNDHDTLEYRELLKKMDILDEHVAELDGVESGTLRSTIIHAQLDLIAAINYVLTIHDSFEYKAALRTVQELSVYSGEELGKELYYLLED